jgi:hypothetical protein
MKFILRGVCVKPCNRVEYTVCLRKTRNNLNPLSSPAGKVLLSRIFEEGQLSVGSRLFVPMLVCSEASRYLSKCITFI